VSNAAQQEELKKRIAIGVFAVAFLGIAVYAYNAFFATGPAPLTSPAATAKGETEAKPAAGTAASTSGNTQNGSQQVGLGVAPGVPAKKMASTSSSLDPTLDETAMLRTEGLVYSGSGRNIFSLTYLPPAPANLPKNVPPPRPANTGPSLPPAPPPYQPPPIDLKYFGVEIHSDGTKQAFLSHKDDIYLASKGDIVARIYKILDITDNNIQVEDLQNHQTKTLPLLQN
jgi:hypothetical protein